MIEKSEFCSLLKLFPTTGFVSREAAMPTSIAIAVIRHEVSRSTPFAEGKQPYEFLSLNFVMRETPLLLLFALRIFKFFGHPAIPPFLRAFLEKHSWRLCV